MSRLQAIEARAEEAGETVYERIQTTGVQGYVAKTRKPQWAIDQALLLAVARAAVEVNKWNALVQAHIRKSLQGEQEDVAGISDANSAWSDAMDDLRAALLPLLKEVPDERLSR